MSHPTEEEIFLFDLQGFLILEGVLDDSLRKELLARVHDYEVRDYEDSWRVNEMSQPTRKGDEHQR